MSTAGKTMILRLQAVVYGHDGGQRIVARTEEVSDESAAMINQIVTACIHSEFDKGGWLHWTRPSGDAWIAAAGFKTQDTSGRRTPGYLAVFDSRLPAGETGRNPFRLLLEIRKLVEIGDYASARGIIDPVELSIASESDGHDGIPDDLPASDRPLLVRILSELLAGRRCRVMTEMEEARRIRIISMLMAAFPARLLSGFSFCTDLSQSGHSSLQLGFCSRQVRRILQQSDPDVVEIDSDHAVKIEPAGELEEMRAARLLLKAVQSRSRGRIGERLLKLSSVPPGLVDDILRIHQAHDNAASDLQAVWQEAHRSPAGSLDRLRAWGTKYPQEIPAEGREGMISRILDLTLQGIGSLETASRWLEVARDFGAPLEEFRAERLTSLYRLTADPDIRHEFRKTLERLHPQESSPLRGVSDGELRLIHPGRTAVPAHHASRPPTNTAPEAKPEAGSVGLSKPLQIKDERLRAEEGRDTVSTPIEDCWRSPYWDHEDGRQTPRKIRWWAWIVALVIVFLMLLVALEIFGRFHN